MEYRLTVLGKNKEYWDFLLRLRNEFREFFFRQETITEEIHYAFMEDNYQNYRVCLADGEIAGFIGHVDDDIRLAVDSKYQGMGIGRFMLRHFVMEYPNSHTRIKHGNIPSQKLFDRCGFIKTHSDEDFIYYAQKPF